MDSININVDNTFIRDSISNRCARFKAMDKTLHTDHLFPYQSIELQCMIDYKCKVSVKEINKIFHTVMSTKLTDPISTSIGLQVLLQVVLKFDIQVSNKSALAFMRYLLNDQWCSFWISNNINHPIFQQKWICRALVCNGKNFNPFRLMCICAPKVLKQLTIDDLLWISSKLHDSYHDDSVRETERFHICQEINLLVMYQQHKQKEKEEQEEEEQQRRRVYASSFRFPSSLNHNYNHNNNNNNMISIMTRFFSNMTRNDKLRIISNLQYSPCCVNFLTSLSFPFTDKHVYFLAFKSIRDKQFMEIKTDFRVRYLKSLLDIKSNCIKNGELFAQIFFSPESPSFGSMFFINTYLMLASPFEHENVKGYVIKFCQLMKYISSKNFHFAYFNIIPFQIQTRIVNFSVQLGTPEILIFLQNNGYPVNPIHIDSCSICEPSPRFISYRPVTIDKSHNNRIQKIW